MLCVYKAHMTRWPSRSKICFSHKTLYCQFCKLSCTRSSSHGPRDPAKVQHSDSVFPLAPECQSTHGSMQTELGILVAHILSPPTGTWSKRGCASKDDVTFYPDYMVPPGVTCIKRCTKFLAPAYSTFCTGNNTSAYFFSCFSLLSGGTYHAFARYTTLKTVVHWYKFNQALYLVASWAWRLCTDQFRMYLYCTLSCYTATEKLWSTWTAEWWNHDSWHFSLCLLA